MTIQEYREKETARRGRHLLAYTLSVENPKRVDEDPMKQKAKTQVVIQRHCRRRQCGYAWKSKGKDKPKACPRCKSYLWDVAYKEEAASS